MKRILLFLLLVNANTISAQLVVSAGAQLYVQGNAQLTLENTDLVNNGSFTAGTGTISFTGNSSSYISGNQPLQFYKLEINKTAGNSVSLQKMTGVTQQVSFISGFLDLNTYDIDLGTTGVLTGEQETSRIIGANGGQVLFSTILNAPVAVNPANLGAIISSSKNLGNVIIKRGHKSQINSYGLGNSVLRYFDTQPANNNGLNAVLRFQYFDGELNGLIESNLVFWKSTDSIHWINESFTTRNTTSNYVEKTGIPSFARWTLSSINNPLPVKISLFNLKCEGNKVVLNWKTSQEQNSSHFIIERSIDSRNWAGIGNIPAASNSNTEKNYLFTDNDPLQNGYYRIVQYDLDGKFSYTNMIRSSCGTKEDFKIWPNPFRDKIFISITAESSSVVTMKLFDSKGALVKKQDITILNGMNQVTMELASLPAGAYHLLVDWNNGERKRTALLIKQ